MASSRFTPVTHRRDELIATAAARQHGVVTRRQLEEAGFTHTAVGRRLESGRLRPLHRGVYLALPYPLPHTSEMAAVLACGPHAALSHISGGALLELNEAVAGPVDVTAAGHRGRCAGIRVHQHCLTNDERTVRDGIPVTSPARTLLDLALLLPPRQLELAVARAERAGLITRAALRRLASERPARRGARALEVALGGPDGPALTRSAAEETFLALVRKARLPQPECNVSVGPYVVDFLFRRAGIAIEVDGFRHHGSRQRFEADRRRDSELAAGGLTVIRLTWRQIAGDALATAVQVGQALAVATCRR